MASADGSIVITTEVDDKKASRELDKLTKKIEKLEQSLASDQAQRGGIQRASRGRNDQHGGASEEGIGLCTKCYLRWHSD